MDRAIAARIQEWETRPVSGGYSGLRELAEASFSGAVTTGTAWLFLLNGRIVGVADGSISDFEGGDATAYLAPDPGLPLLFTMQEQGGETRAKYYTDDNPLPEVHETLTEAGFTGYIELSENVLSGDYYVVYYGGKSMSVAFVGNSEKLLTGDEAFRQAADEVGIYEVTDIELDVRNVPAPSEADAGGAAAVDANDGGPSVEGANEPTTTVPDEDSGTTQPPEAEEPAEPEPVTPDEPPAESSAEPAAEPTEAQPPEAAAEPAGDPDESGDPDDPFSQEAAWRETRTIPALDPEESETPQAAEDGGQQATEPAPAPEPEPATEQLETPSVEESETGAVDSDRLAELEAAIEAQSETIAKLESKLESSSEETQQLREEREKLRAELESARSGEGGAEQATVGESLDPETALDQTDLFVRYGSKGKATLETAHDGDAERDAVVENLRIDHHTRFEDTAVTVDGQPFEAFLRSSLEYRFVDWLVTEFLFEIQDTGSQRGLRELFDAIPLIDRVEFQGTVTWRDQEAGETHSETFDVVCRDRMGQALVVANLNDVRDPATGDMMDALIEGASTIAGGAETLGGAFMVTSSFFRPDALETTSEATGGGLLSREKRWSYVKLDRRHGFHLCLVEARGDDFHVAVPEL